MTTFADATPGDQMFMPMHGLLLQDKSLYGRAEREFKNAGVANHPGDKGMAAIAEVLVKALPK